MINILINVWSPVEKGEEVYKKYLEVERVFPMDQSKIKPVIPWGTWAVKSGNKGAGIFETPDDEFENTIKYFVTRLTMYADAIEGYRFEIAGDNTSEKARMLIGKDLSQYLDPQ